MTKDLEVLGTPDDGVTVPEGAFESARAAWSKTAAENGWAQTPQYVQLWAHPKTGQVWNSVSHIGMTCDILVWECDCWDSTCGYCYPEDEA